MDDDLADLVAQGVKNIQVAVEVGRYFIAASAPPVMEGDAQDK
jgi:hypothetical protein